MPPRHLDEIDRRILTELQRDSSRTNAELARTVGLSASPCLARVRQLERDGLVKGHVVETALQTFDERMKAFPEVMECYLMTGDSDYLVRLIVPDMARAGELHRARAGDDPACRQYPLELRAQAGEAPDGAAGLGEAAGEGKPSRAPTGASRRLI